MTEQPATAERGLSPCGYDHTILLAEARQQGAQQAIEPDALGKALHQARNVGGPWHPCGPWEYGYDSGTGSYECECGSMARHLLAILDASAEPAEEEK